MFKAADGNVFVGADFSQQEPRLLAAYSGDNAMIDAYKQNKDLYATIASQVYNNNYDDNREFYPDGTPNPEGKKRRTSVKSLLLGIMYGRGAASIAEQLNCSAKEAQKFIDDFYTGFPAVKQWVDKTEEDAKKNGYVEDFWGRRRRLPDIQLEKYEVTSKVQKSNFNPLLHTKGVCSDDSSKIIEYKNLLEKARSKKDVDAIKTKALTEGISIKDNTGFVSQAQRQCVNARVQGGAASMTKIAMRKIFDNQELRKLGFKLVLQIHDEVIGDCPKETAEEAGELLSSIMRTAVADRIRVPFKCDVDISPCWYYNDFRDIIKQDYDKFISENTATAFTRLCEKYTECTSEQLKLFIQP